LTQALSQVGEILKEQLDRAQSSAKPWADNTGRSLVDLSRQTTAQIRKRPIATAAAVVGLGVGLAFLLSGRARAGVANVGSQAVNTYKRYRR
jgi:hypothetical protein